MSRSFLFSIASVTGLALGLFFYEFTRTLFLVRRCGWCGKFMGLKMAHGARGTSHTICKECVRRTVRQ